MIIKLGMLQGLQRIGWYGSFTADAEVIIWNPCTIPPYRGFNYFIPLYNCPTDRVIMNFQFCPVGVGQFSQNGLIYDVTKSAEYNMLAAYGVLGNLIPLDYKLDSGARVHARISKYLVAPRKLTISETEKITSFEIGMCKEFGVTKLGGGPSAT